MHSVYGLCDPRTGNVRYVGVSVSVNERYSHHLLDRKSKDKFAWIQELKQAGLKPTLTILEKDLDLENGLRRECYWISYYSQQGASLFNFDPALRSNMVSQSKWRLFENHPDLEGIPKDQWFTPTKAAEYLSQKAGRKITTGRLAQLRKEKRVRGIVSGRATVYIRRDLDNADASLHFRTR